MPYFFNNSETTTSVEVGNGEVVSVFPKDTVFIEGPASSKREVKRMISLGILQRTGNPNRREKRVPMNNIQGPTQEDLSTKYSNAMLESNDLEASNRSVENTEEVESKPRKRRTRSKTKD
jgi:hypothetical protein